MNELQFQVIPETLKWVKEPLSGSKGADESLTIHTGEITDCFIDPAGNPAKDDAPYIVFHPKDSNFLLSARVHVDFQSLYDAGALILRERDDLWGKVCFEFSAQRTPTVVSVVTRGLSDDCVSAEIIGNEVYLRIAHTPKVTAFHYSTDGHYWTLVRYFTLGQLHHINVGFLAQSPTGPGCQVRFSDIHYTARALQDYRNGE